VHAPSTCDLDVADDALAEHDAYAIVRMHHTGPKRSVYIPPELAHSFAGIAETYGRLMYTNALLLAGRTVHALLALDAWCARKADALQGAWTHATGAVWGYVRRLSHVRERIYSTTHLPAGLPTGTCTLTFAGEGTRMATAHAPRAARTYAVVAEATLVGYHALRRVAFTIVRGHVDIK
jgi:hypothetical protein